MNKDLKLDLTNSTVMPSFNIGSRSVNNVSSKNKSYITVKQKQLSNDSFSSKVSNNSFKSRRIKRRVIKASVEEYKDISTIERPASRESD